MKASIKILSCILLAFSAINAHAQSKVAKINVKASIYCDHCKKCESCGARLENAVYKEKGIKRVDIDEQQKTVNITYNPSKTNPEQLRRAIAKAGFDADDIKADPIAYGKLDDCCKKQ